MALSVEKAIKNIAARYFKEVLKKINPLINENQISEAQKILENNLSTFSSDEELSLYDMLFRDDLSKNDIKKLKEVAASLLQKIKAKIAEFDHWTDKQETKAQLIILYVIHFGQSYLTAMMK